MSELPDLREIFKDDQVRTDSETLRIYGLDWTRLYEPNPQAVVFPTSSIQVQNLVRWARKTKTPLVPSGGRTGLSGGAVAAKKEIVVSFDRMNRLLEISKADALVRVEAGIVTETLQEAARNAGLYFPVDFASRGSSQIGGNIATNAGGINVIRYGMIRDWVLGLEVVTGTGEILHLNGALLKNNSGYDLKQLYIGSEGTLGFITEATLRLTTPPKESRVLLLAAHALEESIKVLELFRKELRLSAFEFFSDQALDFVLKSNSTMTAPFSERYPYYFLVEFEAATDSEMNLAMAAFDSCLEQKTVADGVVSQNDSQKLEFWKYREQISESLASSKPIKSDISVRISDIPQFVKEVEKNLFQKQSAAKITWFGHIGDGNLHVNLLCSTEEAKSLLDLLFKIVQKYKGSISAEHGIGLTKKPFLSICHSEPEIELMRSLKKVFDPDQILNPGKIFD